MMNEELKPCPFCGMIPKIEQDTVEEYGEKRIVFYVKCSNEFGCDCIPETDNHSSIEDAIKAWNTRYEATCNMEPPNRETMPYPACSACGAPMLNAPNSFCAKCGAKVVE